MSEGVSVKKKNIARAAKFIFVSIFISIFSCKYGKYVGSIIDDSVTTCDEIKEETKVVPTKSASTKAVLTKYTLTNFCILLAFSLNTIALLIALSICCHLIKV